MTKRHSELAEELIAQYEAQMREAYEDCVAKEWVEEDSFEVFKLGWEMCLLTISDE